MQKLVTLPIINKKIFPAFFSRANNDFYRHIVNRPVHNYSCIKILKKNGNFRTLAIPNNSLARIQKWILLFILNRCTVSKYSRAFVKNLSFRKTAELHKQNEIVVCLDVFNFFPSIKFDLVKKVFSTIGYSEDISSLLAKLCYHPFLGLPQGACTSPALSNLVMYEFDCEVGKYCEERNITYTRYADDLVFSGEFEPHTIINFVVNKLKAMDLKINKQKIKIMSSGRRQYVNGVVVNNVRVRLAREYRLKIRQELHYIKKYGLENHLQRINYPLEKKYNYFNVLLGKINYALYIDPDDKVIRKYRDELKTYFFNQFKNSLDKAILNSTAEKELIHLWHKELAKDSQS